MGKDQDILKAVKDNDQATLHKLLQKAAKQAKTKILGNSKKLNINYQDVDGMSALHQAALMSSDQMLKALLDSGALPTLTDNKGMTALHYASWQGVVRPVQILLQKGAPVNQQALTGDIPLHLASQHGHVDVVSLLLSHQADPTVCNKDLRTSLDLACQFGQNRVVELLLRSNLCQKLLEDSPTDLLDNSRTTCLHLAARNGHVDVIKLLLQAGMNINRSTPKGTCLHEATQTRQTETVGLLLQCGCDMTKPNMYNQTALDIIQALTVDETSKRLIYLLKEASCALYARAVKDHTNFYDSGSLLFKEGDIIRVLNQQEDGIWLGYVHHENRMNKTGTFPANCVVLIDSKVVVSQQEQFKQGSITGPAADVTSRGHNCSSSNSTTNQHHGSIDRGSLDNSSSIVDGHPPCSYSFPTTLPSNFPPPPSAMLASYPPGSLLNRDCTGADSGFSSLHSLPQYTPSSPATPQQFCKSPFAFGPTLTANHTSIGKGCIPEHQHNRHQQNNDEWSPTLTSLPALGGVGGDMRGSSPARDSPGHSNRNSAGSSDSGRGCSTGHSGDIKHVHNYVNAQVSTQQNRLSGQSNESGVSCPQSYQSTSSSSQGSLDLLEEPSLTSTINVTQLFQAGVPDNEVLYAWLHDLHFEEYYPLFGQAGYDLPTISRMTPEDLTAVGITKPAHRKRLKTEIARLSIPDGIPDFRPNDLMEWLHLLGLGDYMDTLCDQGYDSINYVTDITWEDLEEIGIRKLGHQKKIMLAIDRLKRLPAGVKHLSLVDEKTASLELLEPPPPAPPISGRWSEGEVVAIPSHLYDGALAGARPKKSPSGDSISTTGSSHSGSSTSSGAHKIAGGNTGPAGEMRVISIPREDAGLAGAIPYCHSSAGNAGNSFHTDVVSVQVKKNRRPSSSEDKKDTYGQQLMYQSYQGSPGRCSDSEIFFENSGSRSFDADNSSCGGSAVDRRTFIAKGISKSEVEKHEYEVNADDSSSGGRGHAHKSAVNSNNVLRVDTRDHIYDMPQISPSPKSPKPKIMPKPSASVICGLVSPSHVTTTSDTSVPQQVNQSPGGKGGKKVPPLPPVRIDSIRTESVSESTPSSPSKTPVTPGVITVSASIHPQPTQIPARKQPPPPVMQKPQKPMSPAMTNKLHLQHNDHPLQQHQLGYLVSPKSKPSKPVLQKVVILPTTGQYPHSPTPAQGTHIPVFMKPQVSAQQQLQPKSSFSTKSPLTSMITNVPQQHLPQYQPLSPASHKPHIVSPSQPISQLPKGQAGVLTSQHFGPNPGHNHHPQVQAFASCMKSLSEKFGKNTSDDDQFPDNVSTDSDDFPPAPPPIAMDIITPKIHNYGIPSSRDKRKPEFNIKHHGDYAQRSRPVTTASMNLSSTTRLQPELTQKNLNPHQGHHMQTSAMKAPIKILPQHLAAVQLRKQSHSSSSGSSSPSSDREPTPELDSLNTISKEKRSESTTSFESNSSSSSIDSNTLPFANENVGTIKQRAVNAKPNVVQPVALGNGQRILDSSAGNLDSDPHRIMSGFSNSSRSTSVSSQNNISSVNDLSKNCVCPSDVLSQQQQQLYQRQFSNPSSSSGTIQPPTPSKKPVLSSKSLRLTGDLSSSQTQQHQAESTTANSQPQMGNVLNDIDNMLQGLTDELDAMLEEEMAC